MGWSTVLFLLIISLIYVECQNDTKKKTSLFRKYKKTILEDLESSVSDFPLNDLGEFILFDIIPIILEQKPFNADGKFEQNKNYLFKDISNDDIAFATTEAIITRSGYKVERHKVIAEDGYITHLYRIINPLADRTKLKQPPVMVMHGGTIDPSTYLWTSAIQHHPEKFPRTLKEDGPITSWNRSLGFMLANNGYDVWLVATRGCNKENKGRIKINELGVALGDETSNTTALGNLIKLKDSFDYYHYSFDEIIQYEVERQLDKILQLTGAKNVSLFTYSFSSPITLSLLGSRPEVGLNKIHNYIIMAPILNLDSSSVFNKLFCEIIPFVPAKLGNLIFPGLLLTQAIRNLINKFSQSRKIRYKLAKFVTGLLYGSSGKYRTVLEPSVLGHQFLPVSFKQIQQFCQFANANRYQRYDYGKIKNKLVYGRLVPPEYDVTNIHVKNWLLISAENDNLSPKSSVEQILKVVNPKPLKHIEVPGYNHLDLSAAFDNDILVNLPVLKFLNKFAF